MRGRSPAGLEYVDGLDGAPAAKQRLKLILETLFGVTRPEHAWARLGIGASRFHFLRDRALQGALDALAPRPAGRPGRLAGDLPRHALKEALADKEEELRQAQLREEVARIVPRRRAAGKQRRPPKRH